MKIAVALLVLLAAAPAAAQTPVAYAGQSVRFEQDGDWTHHYVCYDAEEHCVRLERATGYVDAATPAGHISYRTPLPALPEGPHRVLVWASNEHGTGFAFLDFVYVNREAPPPPPSSSAPPAPAGLRFVTP